MCGGPDSLRKKLLPPGFSMEEKAAPPTPKTASNNSLFLELAAMNDLAGFKTAAAADGGLDVNATAPWYGRRIGTKKMGWDQRTPLMVAALYGSADVLGHVLLSAAADAVNLASPSDGATALHCAAAGGAPNAAEIVRLLLAANADLHAVDAAGNRPADVIVTRPGAGFKGMMKAPTAAASDGGSPKSVESEKKEYPVDASLPDINSGVYGTDEFRMYCFKVAPCSRAYSHDWTECPFVHPGENARRRDPRKYEYSCVPCPEFRKGVCRHGDGCEYAHGVFESWLHPAQYRTRLCKDEAGCARKVCFFAHKLDDLRKPDTTFPSIDLLPPSSAAGGALKLPSMGWPGQLSAAGRLKASLSAKGLDLGMDLPALDGLGFPMQSSRSGALSSVIGSRSGKFGGHHLPLGEVMGGGFDAASAATSQFQSSSLLKNLGYGGNLNMNVPSSPARTNSPMGGLDPRAAAFAKRSLSFCDRSLANTDVGMPVTSTAAAAAAAAAGSNSMMLSSWSSPNGKLDWAMRGDELHRLTKSATFAIRSGGSSDNDGGYGLGDGNEVDGTRGWVGADRPRRGSAGSSPEKRPAWGGEHAYIEKEQMVA